MSYNVKNACIEAEKLGAEAFARGVVCAPALDVNLPKVYPPAPEVEQNLTEKIARSKEVVKLLEAWHRGWTLANLAAPLPEEDLDAHRHHPGLE